MASESPPAALPDLPEGTFEGPNDFAERVRIGLAHAARAGWPEIVLCDPDFADWPLGEREVVQALQDWSATGRSLRMVARRFDVFQRHHARFVHWRQMWDHIVQCRACTGAGTPEVPSAIWTPHWFLHRIDPVRSRGVSGSAAAERVALRHGIDECFQRGRPACAASVLGL